MSENLITVGTSVVFLSGLGYKNQKGQVKYDVKVGAKGIVRKATLNDGKPFYDVELLVGKTLTNETTVYAVQGSLLSPSLMDIIKLVEDFPRKPKKHRPWRKFDDSQLEAFAIKNGIEWKRNENPKVNRMFLVKALDDSGIEAPEDETDLQRKIS